MQAHPPPPCPPPPPNSSCVPGPKPGSGICQYWPLTGQCSFELPESGKDQLTSSGSFKDTSSTLHRHWAKSFFVYLFKFYQLTVPSFLLGKATN